VIFTILRQKTTGNSHAHMCAPTVTVAWLTHLPTELSGCKTN